MEQHKTTIYLRAMAAYWLGFGLITTFYPKLMDLFQSEEGINAKTDFSNHVWFHGGLDILAFCVLLIFLSKEVVSPAMIRATAIAALMPTLAIFYSIVATPYWNPLFIGSGLGCLGFAIWGFVLSSKGATPA